MGARPRRGFLLRQVEERRQLSSTVGSGGAGVLDSMTSATANLVLMANMTKEAS
jgi:hypothetical protein